MNGIFGSLFGFIYSIFGYILGFFYELFKNTPAPYVIALIVFTIITRVLLLPTSIPQQKNQAKQFRIQPKLQKLQQKFGNDRQKLSEEQQKLYQKEGYNPMAAGCGPMLISLPLLWGVYGAITRPVSYVLRFKDEAAAFLADKNVTDFFSSISTSKRSSYYQELLLLNQLGDSSSKISAKISSYFSTAQIEQMKEFAQGFTLFGIDLTQTPSIKSFSILWIIPILSGITSFLTSFYSTRMQKKYNPAMSQGSNMLSQGCMMAFMPIFSIYLCFTVPAGVGFYWVISNIFAFFQTVLLSNIYAPPKVAAKNMISDVINRYAYEKSIKDRKKTVE
ncbi:MAG: YidC/Oxa1 family membrane protein insertase [Clostridia bacterium]|nr:YidC/Oxa1 family membrane protein insertase [Clostridia bacterium]